MAGLFGTDRTIPGVHTRLATGVAVEQAQIWARREVVVDVYAVPVETENDDVVPVTMRERVRAEGPSVRTDLAAIRT